MGTTVYLIRHAEAEGNLQRVFHGHTDSDLTENGEKQLALLAERCRTLRFDAVYSSDLKRAVKTAKAASSHLGLPIIETDQLREIRGGKWENVAFEELPRLYPEVNRHWAESPWLCTLPEGESVTHVMERMRRTIGQIAQRHKNQQICVVSHGCAIRAYLCAAKCLPDTELGSIHWCDNTAVSVIIYDESGGTSVRLESDNSHLAPELSTLAKQDWWRKNKKKP